MGKAQEAPVLEILHLFDANDFRPNLDRVLALFDEDATYQINVPARDKLVGRDAIVGELTRQAGDYEDCVCEILTVVSNDRFVVTERVDPVAMLNVGKRVWYPLLAIFEINDVGFIMTGLEIR